MSSLDIEVYEEGRTYIKFFHASTVWGRIGDYEVVLLHTPKPCAFLIHKSRKGAMTAILRYENHDVPPDVLAAARNIAHLQGWR